ncbi:putative transcription regulator protein of MDR efflux pump cluster [Collimonas arenae]|uniref:Putative transcription regulator protein of MDR efflux pump cluster n=1 Tax=Collimonas arenae TaxID=279058 RepID=A0A0A1FBH8_9BURK|nr:putative transcription regulator protein of MDR efflux pump cluster [Collimonas arenae]
MKAMQTFVRIVEANSFSKAAETLDLPRASLTATMKNLEAFLGTQLLQRTTRRLSLTPDGAEYFKKCVEILGAIEESELLFLGPDSKAPKGKLRVDLPGTVGRNLILPHIADFHAMYPEVELTISLTDRLVDIMQEGIDCALRVGRLQDSSLIGRQVGNMRFVTCAAPSYLAKYGTPTSISDLQFHQSIVHFSGRTGRAFDWEFVTDQKVVKVEISGPVAVNDADANVCCALQGLGLAQSGAYQVREHLKSGALVEVLGEWPPTAMPISLLYPQGRMASPKVKVFASWINSLFEGDPDLQQRE